MRPPAEENVDDAQDSLPEVPMQHRNGYRDWHIVFDADGQEVIELATSDEEEGDNEAGGENVGDIDPIAVFWDIEMGDGGENLGHPNVIVHVELESSDSEEEMEVEGGEFKDVGIQCDIENSDSHDSDSDSDRYSENSDSDCDNLPESSGDPESSSSDSDDEVVMPERKSPFVPFVCGGRGRLCI